ncbi:MAG: hypothetical protein WA160_08415 [Pseudobdellovibrio sp.]
MIFNKYISSLLNKFSHDEKNIFTNIVGRVRPLVLGFLILFTGLILDKWWWKIGGVVVIVVFVESIYHYRAKS